MIEPDTVKLLRECDAGVQMGITSIGDVEGRVKNRALRADLKQCREEHKKLASEIHAQLHRFHDEGKAPNPMAVGMSKLKTEMMLGMKKSDRTIADLMTDGCNMGVKSLSRYLNQYAAADEVSKDITKRLIHLEDQLSTDLRAYL